MAAILTLPQVAMAQPKKHGGSKKAPSPPAAEASGSAAGGTGAASGGEIELDEPAPANPAPGTDSSATPAPDASTGTSDSGESGICAVDPSACAKQGDLKELAKRDVKADVYAVQQIYALRRHRFELQPYWSFSLNDQFVSHPGPGLAVNYYITNVLAVGLSGTYYQPFNGDSDFNFQNRRATRIAVPLNEYQMGAAVNFTYVPIYGKFSGFSKFIFHYDGYIDGGVGIMRTRPISVIDPDNRKFDWDNRLTFSLGIGLRVFLNRWFAVTGEIRDYIYQEQLEATNVAATQAKQRDQNTWFGDKQITNNVQAQIGISVFLPFSWEYRLPK